MSNTLVVHKNRTNIVTVSLGYDITDETITSEIRSEPDQNAMLIATWAVEVDDAETGELTLTLTDEDVSDISENRGWMDIKRDSLGLSLPVFDRPLEVEFRGTVTV